MTGADGGQIRLEKRPGLRGQTAGRMRAKRHVVVRLSAARVLYFQRSVLSRRQPAGNQVRQRQKLRHVLAHRGGQAWRQDGATAAVGLASRALQRPGPGRVPAGEEGGGGGQWRRRRSTASALQQHLTLKLHVVARGVFPPASKTARTQLSAYGQHAQDLQTADCGCGKRTWRQRRKSYWCWGGVC